MLASFQNICDRWQGFVMILAVSGIMYLWSFIKSKDYYPWPDSVWPFCLSERGYCRFVSLMILVATIYMTICVWRQ